MEPLNPKKVSKPQVRNTVSNAFRRRGTRYHASTAGSEAWDGYDPDRDKFVAKTLCGKTIFIDTVGALAWDHISDFLKPRNPPNSAKCKACLKSRKIAMWKLANLDRGK